MFAVPIKTIFFDILLTAIWSILMIYSLSGSLWHELLGLGILGLFIIHIGLHLKMIGSVIIRPFREYPAVIIWLRRGWNVAAAFLIVCGSIASFQYELPAFAKAGESPSDETTDSPDSDTLIETPDHPSNLMTIAYTYPTYKPTDSDEESLEEYLGSQICTICHRCCPLTALQCSRGQSALEQATQEYYANHNDSSENDEIQNDNEYDNQPADNSDDPVSEPDLTDILSIMGLYVGGTYYVSQITDARRKRRLRLK